MQQLVPRSDSAPDLDALYLHPPGVRLGMVASVDGAAVLEGRSAGLSGDADKQVFRALRRHADVVLVGAGTARAERYRPAVVPEEHQARRLSRGQAPVPRIAVVTAGAGLPGDSPLLVPDSGLLLLTTAAGAAAAPPDVEVAVVGEEQVDLARVVDALHARGLQRVLCEGGPTLAGGLLEAGLVDEVCATTSPLLAGGDGPRLVVGAPETARPLALLSLLEDDGVLLARWKVLP
ncbi:MAG: pyrimidine reductase family protein [Frankiales bacterium]|nr:pyrimidine reductase family protein [Frankiales bacterium]